MGGRGGEWNRIAPHTITPVAGNGLENGRIGRNVGIPVPGTKI